MEYDLERFVTAQADVYAEVVRELSSGRKTGHWMWFIFPQIRGLGRSETARFYAISSLEEAQAYIEHPLLGRRLRDCTRLVVDSSTSSLAAFFGAVDALKFRSSMTLFSQATADRALFQEALNRYCGGQPDQATLDLLGPSGHS